MFRKHIADKFKNRIEPSSYLIEDVCSRLISFCNSNSLKQGINVHSPIIKLGLHHHLYINNNLLSLYAKCFGVAHARHFFDEMPERDVVSWTGILSAYFNTGNYENVLEFFDLMVGFGQSPNEFTLSGAIRSCAALGDIGRGERFQGYVVKQGLERNSVLSCNLIDMYAKCNLVEEAYKLFGFMDNGGDIVSWTTMISSFVEVGKWGESVELFTQMIEAGVRPNGFTFVKLLAACGRLGINYGKMVHAHVIRWCVQLSVVLKTALVDMYMKCRRMEDAVKLSKLTPEYDVLLWTALISGFSQNFEFRKAIAAFHEMERSGTMPNNYTYSSLINACSSIPSLELGKQIHSLVILSGLEVDVSVGNALIDMYMKCSPVVADALRAFRMISAPNVISWTSLIAGLAERGFEQDCLQLFEQMQAEGVQPNSFTLSGILGACNTIESLAPMIKLHGYIVKSNACDDIVVGNALVDAYARFGMANVAWDVVSIMSKRDAITYTSLASRMNQIGHHEEALNVITHMYNDDVKMDEFSLSSFLSASASVPTIETGKQLHCHSVKSGLGIWISVSNGLVDLYGKCGSLEDTQRVFSEIAHPDVVSWNGLISALASSGYISSALSSFDDMRLAGIEPDSVTFLLVLSACARGKLFVMGLEYFHSMEETHGISPLFDHYICLVDLLGQAGRLEEAVEVIQTMPFRPDARVFKTLLLACKLHRNVPLGEDMARRGLELDPVDPSFYILLANLYDVTGRPEFSEKTHGMMRDKGLSRKQGHSWVEIRSKVHLFVAGDRSHPQLNEIEKKLESLASDLTKRGYVYHSNADSTRHSERLAVAFSLLNTPSNAPILIVKNDHFCKDCHKFIMLLTRFVDREITVKIGTHIHTFNKGHCSCSTIDGYQIHFVRAGASQR